MKRYAWLIVVAMVVLLPLLASCGEGGACGSPTTTTTTPPPTTTTTPPPTTTTTTPPPTTTTTPPPTTTTTTPPPTTTTTTPPPTTTTTTPGLVAEGRDTFIDKGCIVCHTIQGFPEAQGTVGPELTHFASQSLILDVLPNTEENLTVYLEDPKAIKQGTKMPNQHLTDSEIEALVAFLQTLE